MMDDSILTWHLEFRDTNEYQSITRMEEPTAGVGQSGSGRVGDDAPSSRMSHCFCQQVDGHKDLNFEMHDVEQGLCFVVYTS